MLESNILIENIFNITQDHPDKLFAKLLFSGKEDKIITYGDLLANAGRYANLFKSNGIKQNQAIVIILKHSAELIYSFVGAMLYGAIPSIFAPPSVKIPTAYYKKTLPLLLKNCNTRFLLTYSELTNELLNLKIRNKIKVLEDKAYFNYSNTFKPLPSYKASQVVLLQHSSGTTGLKKGIALSSQAVINQIRNYTSTLNLKDTDKIVSWLPLYHDMGLIACFILPLVCAIPLVMLSAFDWIQNPLILLQAIYKEKTTLCWLPNFAYNFLATRIPDEKLNGLNLSSIRALINCAEPISAQSHKTFYEKFKRYGLSKEALCTCYAMAENTFAITQGGIKAPLYTEEIDYQLFIKQNKAVLATEDTQTKREMVSSGRLIPHNHIRIVDDKGNNLPERHIGEIAIKSDSMLIGYYNRPGLTKEVVKDGWYFTGDLGYVTDKELFVTGRKKDMIIVAGKNIYPQDIEEIVSAIDGIYAGRVVAFGSYNEETGTEDVVILAEAKNDTLEDKTKQLKTKLAIIQAVRDNLECIANEVVFLPNMWLLKSSSGKISRPGNREKYLREIKGIKNGKL